MKNVKESRERRMREMFTCNMKNTENVKNVNKSRGRRTREIFTCNVKNVKKHEKREKH